MKIIKPDMIHISEKEFIDTINAELDWEVIENMLLEKHKFAMQDEVDYKQGDLIVYDNQIAYRFDFEIKVPLSVVFGRDGKCLELSTSGDLESEDLESEDLESEDLESELKEESDDFSDSLLDEDQINENLMNDELMNDELMNDNETRNSGTVKQYDNPGTPETPNISGKQDISKMAADIADMISDINQSDTN